MHRARLEELAAHAESLAANDRLSDARAAWIEARELLPPESAQHATVRARIADLSKRIAATPDARRVPERFASWRRSGGAGVVALVLLVLGKLKFLALGLTKASTFVSMFAFFGVYWSAFGWPLALGLVISIYIHEMGHVAELRRLGVHAGAPLFIPGVGAVVMLREHIDDPSMNARIGLAGPVWGLTAGLAAYGIGVATGAPIWAAIAHLTGLLNLFNLIPVWQLDGARGFEALSTWQRLIVVATIIAAFALTGQKLLLLVGLVAVYRAFQRTDAAGDATATATFVVLVGALSWLSLGVV